VNDPERVRLASLRGLSGSTREGGAERAEAAVPWHRWGPYLAERQWGTVREDYSPWGTAWEDFSHDQARSRAYRWGEDGLLGICDDQMRVCFALAMWNGVDPILKERLFGLTGNEGNHGEDVKEEYYYLDGTPTHSYMRASYRYPQRAFPYAELVAENRRRTRLDAEFELADTGIFVGECFFDVAVEYAKADPTDIVIRIQVTNHAPQTASLHLLPTLWFRNTWAWADGGAHPRLRQVDTGLIEATFPELGTYWLACDAEPRLLFTNNETNSLRLWGVPNRSPYVKDGFDDYLVHNVAGAVNPDQSGTRAAAHYDLTVPPASSTSVLLRLSSRRLSRPCVDAASILETRAHEADLFYANRFGFDRLSEPERRVQRQAFAGLLWTKQVYAWDIEQWLAGDPAGPEPAESRKYGRNSTWWHFNTHHVLSVPDTWEYPWFAAWDLAFHCVPLGELDSEFAKDQLEIMLREWYMHPNGQLPAYEWAFSDVNPPVHAWATWRVYETERRTTGVADRAFLERVFHKLLLNFTWWVNRKDPEGLNVFQGGFLGLDNIGVIDRNAELPAGGYLEQSDGTAWMAMYTLNMLQIALELARANSAYEDVANKFFQHFLYVASAMNNVGGKGFSLWDDHDEFFYDVLRVPGAEPAVLRVRSLVGLIPLLAVETIEPSLLEQLPGFGWRVEWFLEHRPALASLVSRWYEPGLGERRLLALVRGHRMKRLLARMLDPAEFLSPYGIRSVSKFHGQHPFSLDVAGQRHAIGYEPGESTSGIFGGNSNWRGPIWMPINFLLIESLRKFHHYYGDDFLVEHPTGSGTRLTLNQIADDLSARLTRLFLPPLQPSSATAPGILFHEFFHGDTGKGLGASHQTGWTALIASLLAEHR